MRKSYLTVCRIKVTRPRFLVENFKNPFFGPPHHAKSFLTYSDPLTTHFQKLKNKSLEGLMEGLKGLILEGLKGNPMWKEDAANSS